jgi:hypothetical protein
MAWKYELHGWRLESRVPGAGGAPDGFRLRPGPGTLRLRLGVTLYMGLLIGLILILTTSAIGYLLPRRSASPQDGVPGTLTDPQVVKQLDWIEKNLSKRDREREERKIAAHGQQSALAAGRPSNVRRAVVWWSVGVLCFVLGLIGLAAPISTRWNRLALDCPTPDVLRIIDQGIWTRTRTIRMADYVEPVLVEYKVISGGFGYHTPAVPTRRWAWVLVMPPAPSNRRLPKVEFWLRVNDSRARAAQLLDEELEQFMRPFIELTKIQVSKSGHGSPHNRQQ